VETEQAPSSITPAVISENQGISEAEAAAKISALIAPKPPRAPDGKFQPQNPQPAAEPEPVEQSEPEAAPAEATSEEDIEIDDGEATAADDNQPDIEMPKSWSSTDRAEWDKLTPEAKAIVQRRETQRDHGMRKLADQLKVKETEVTKAIEQIDQERLQLAQAAQRYSSDAVKQFQAKFGDVKDVQALSRENPARYLEMDAAWKGVQAAQHEAQMLQQQQQQETLKKLSDWRMEENEKLAELAGLKDEASASEFEKSVMDFTNKVGIPAERVSQYRADELLIVRDAMKWRNAVAKKDAAKKAQTPPPPVLKPGTPTSKASLTKQANQQQLSQTLKKTGSESAAAALIKARVFGR
jgi:hypothetical protein